MKRILFNILIFNLLFVTNGFAQSFKVRDVDITAKPVSPELYGSFYELGFGRSDLFWGELLFNRDFELERPLGEKNSWLRYSGVQKELEDWWHTGYEEQKWYVVRNGEKNENIPLYHANYWPAGHGKRFVQMNNTTGESPYVLAQDRIYLKKGCGYVFSGLFSNGTYFSPDKFSEKYTTINICIYKEGDFTAPLSVVALDVRTNQLVMHELEIPPLDYEGWCTFAVEVPAGVKVGLDLLSLMADDTMNGWKKEPLDMIKNELRPKSIRFPGGCFASLYDWRDGVGPREQRPVSYDSWWECEQVNDVGTVEFVEMCRYLEAEPFLCVPVMFNDAHNAAEWVDFCNNPDNERRIAYGYPEPLNVKYWELENEPYRRYDAITFAERSAEFAKLMKAKDPTIKIATGNYWMYNRRFPEMLEIVGPYVDLITNRGGSIAEMHNDLKILAEYNQKHGTDIRLCHTEFRAPLSRKNTSVDGLNQVQNDKKETRFNRSVRWEYAMNMAEQYVQFQRMGGDFHTANFTNLTDGWGESLINIAKEQTYLSAPGVAYSLLTSLDMVYPLQTEAAVDDENMVIQAAWNKDRNKLTIVLLNFNRKETICALDLSGMGYKFAPKAKSYRIAPGSHLDFNSPSDPAKIYITESEQAGGRKMSAKMPAMSMYALEINIR